MLLKTAKRPATTVWSPLNDQRGLLAAGTVANAIDDSFETTADLEIFAVDFSAGSPKEMPVKGSIKCNERFHRLAWGGLSGSGGLPYGILAGGMVDGSIGLWNPARLIKAEEGDPVVARVQKHKGPVRGLDFNPFKPNLLASGATESEILIWNLQNPASPDVYTPGQPTQPLMDINCVAWNPKVEHILASTGASGTSVVWDLRQKRPVISFTDTVNKTSRAALAWNPEVATQVMVASDDDSTPILQMWDLRNAHSPAKVLQGHSRGILAMSWCVFDTAMLLTCGKDNRTLCWDPNSGQIMCELPASSNWNFDVSWSPKLPAILSTSSFDGIVNVYSLTDTGGGSGGAASAPGWLKRPAGASFGFGGQLVSFCKSTTPENPRKTVQLRRPCTEQELLARADGLDMAVSGGGLREFCQSKIASAESEDARNEWELMNILFEQDARRRLMDFVGFSSDNVAQQVLSLQLSDLRLDDPVNAKKPSIPSAAPAAAPEPEKPKEEVAPAPEPPAEEAQGNAVDSLFGESAEGGDDPFATALASGPPPEAPPPAAPVETPAEPPKPAEKPLVDEPVGPNVVLDDAIKRAVIAGNFEAAVDCCFRFGRMADALLLAATGGRELFQRTQERYLDLYSANPFIRVTRRIVNRQLQTLVEESDTAAWKETLAVLCTYATAEEFASLCDALGTRLKTAGRDVKAATLCYICAGNVHSTVQVWLEELAMEQGAATAKLQSLIEKICVLLVLDVCKQDAAPPIVGDKFAEYAEALAAQGHLSLAMQYLVRASAAASQPAAVLRERIFNSDARNAFSVPHDQHPLFPFERFDVGVAPARPVSSQQPVGVPQQQAQQQYNDVAAAFGDAFNAAPAPVQQQQQAVQPAPAAQQQYAQPYAQPQQQYQQPQQQPQPYQQQQQQQSFQPPAQPAQPAYQQQQPYQPPQPAFQQPQAQAFPAQPAHTPQQPVAQAQPYFAQPAPAQQPAPAPAFQQPTAQPTTAFQAPAQPVQPVQPPQPATPAPAAQQQQQQQQHQLTPEEDWVCKAVQSLQGRICAGMPKKMADDVAKRLGELDTKLKAGQVSRDVTSQLTQWCQAMDRNDAATAGSIQTALTSTVWDDHKNWLQATKRMVDQAKKSAQ